MWNSLPSYIVKAPSFKAFERRIDRYWRDQYIVYNYEVALSLGHSYRDEKDIVPDSSDNSIWIYRSNDLRPVKTYVNLTK